MKSKFNYVAMTVSASILISLAACSGLGGGIKQLQPEVNGKFKEYFQITDNAPTIEREQDGEFVQYSFKTFVKVKKPFACVDYFDTQHSIFDHEKLEIHLKFYDADKKPLPINSTMELTFFTVANTTVGSNFCSVISKPAGSEDWYTFKTRNFKKESSYFEKYPVENIKYFTVETGD